jgi:hypothetical protein
MSVLKRKLVKVVGKLLPEVSRLRSSYNRALENIINHRNLANCQPEAGASVSIIIFSKDRAIQLHALLASFFDLVRGKATIKVLYTASTKAHVAAYDKLKLMFGQADVSFRLEQNFRDDLLHTLAEVSTDKLMFLVDDIIFTEPLDLEDFIRYNTNYFVPTLRMGDHLTYSYTTRQQQPLPEFISGVVSASDMLVWKWQEGQLDWAYPLSVDGHLFDTQEMRTIIQMLDFRAPNSLEESMQLFNPIYKTRHGLAMKKSVILNIPINKVQQENDNHAGNQSTDYLLTKWQQGYGINFRKLRHFRNESAHQEVNLEFEKIDTGI